MAQKYQSREERRKQLASGNKAKKGKKKPKNMLKRIVLALIALGIIGILTGAATFAIMVKGAPKLNESALKDPFSSKIYDMNNNLVTEIGVENRDYVAYEDIPKVVENAFLATEDARFYQHHGIDVIRLGGAVLANITDGFGSEGASTITQQLVKNSFLGMEKTLSRKAQEAWLAFQLERKYTKQQIFEMYVNKIFMSENSHGIATASDIYFGKELKDLKLHEAALLAGMPQSPNNYNPFRHPERAEKRRNIVLSLMHQHGFISKNEMEEAKKIPVEQTLVKEEDRKKDDKPFDAFVDRVIDEVEKQGKFDVFSDGLKIYTTLDPNAQTYVEKMLNTNEIVQFPNDEFQAGITLLDTKKGEIRAIGGGRNQKVKRGFNYAIDAKRQPGSTFKPIMDYGPAIEHLKWGTYHVLNDKPYKYKTGDPINNFDRRHLGPMSIREALARSRNIPALQALHETGMDHAKEFAVKLGMPIEEMRESYAIGTFETSTLRMAGAYSAFGNNGFYTEPYAVKKIVFRDGSVMDITPETEVVMKDYTAFMITDMLKSVVRDSYGTGRLAHIPGLNIAGKTGTTNYSEEDRIKHDIPRSAVPDAWFVGYTTNYTAAVWTGYKDQKNYIPIENNQQKIAQILFKNLMQHVSNGIETPDFTVPKSVEKVKIEKGTVPAKLASEFTPKDLIRYEYAVKGNGPKEVSEKYNKLESPSKLKAAYSKDTNEILLTWDHKDKADASIKFEVHGSLDEGPDQQLASTSETGVKIANPVPGGIYSFKVTAVRDTQRSDPAVTTIEIPAPDDEKNKDKEKKNPGGNEDGNGNSGNGNEDDSGNNPGSGNNDGSSDEGTDPNITPGVLPGNNQGGNKKNGDTRP